MKTMTISQQDRFHELASLPTALSAAIRQPAPVARDAPAALATLVGLQNPAAVELTLQAAAAFVSLTCVVRQCSSHLNETFLFSTSPQSEEYQSISKMCQRDNILSHSFTYLRDISQGCTLGASRPENKPGAFVDLPQKRAFKCAWSLQ